ncbi:hypothetical protein GCM10023149_48140 [Mucilaginibacter gynuensis]|uniref:Tellurite resistance protein TerB n=1 Tax=Mucilaginibacter gynuensis TaxID=1302236 RepID=A0ABP8HEI6_9SPHI
MYQRDYLFNEARKMALLLAKLLGLKADGDNEAYEQQFNEILQQEYNAELENLLNLNEADFTVTMQQASYSAEKLNALAQMLYVFAQPLQVDDDTLLLLKKVLIIFDILEQQHHYDSFENITTRQTIQRFITNNYERS